MLILNPFILQELFGHKWTQISDLLETRTPLQVKTYAKKYFQQKVCFFVWVLIDSYLAVNLKNRFFNKIRCSRLIIDLCAGHSQFYCDFDVENMFQTPDRLLFAPG